MNEIPQIQGSPEWLQWRRNRIMSSDIPIILGLSKWCDPHTLWRRKLGFIPEQPVNYAMSRGTELEPLVRDLVCHQTGITFRPSVVQHPELEWAAASLDGLSEDKTQVLEIKCPNYKDHQSAQEGRIPDHYKPQIQWQMFVADVDSCLYASYGHTSDLSLVNVEFDEAYVVETLLPAAVDFRRYLVDMIEPPLLEDDFVHIESPEWEMYAREWMSADESCRFFEEKRKYYQNKLVGLTDDSNCAGNGIKVRRMSRDGSVNWKHLWEKVSSDRPDIKESYNPEEYRAPQIGYWQITKIKE